MSAETMKMPEPIMDPTTREIAASGPMPRMDSVDGLGTGAVWTGAAISPRRWGLTHDCHPERSEGDHIEHGPLRCAQGDRWPLRVSGSFGETTGGVAGLLASSAAF